jgi:hypothetical protein
MAKKLELCAGNLLWARSYFYLRGTVLTMTGFTVKLSVYQNMNVTVRQILALINAFLDKSVLYLGISKYQVIFALITIEGT